MNTILLSMKCAGVASQKNMDKQDKQITVIESVLRKSGKIAMDHFGNITDFKTKDDPSQIVTEVDIKSEKFILESLKFFDKK